MITFIGFLIRVKSLRLVFFHLIILHPMNFLNEISTDYLLLFSESQERAGEDMFEMDM